MAQERVENLQELVSAAESFVREAERRCGETEVEHGDALTAFLAARRARSRRDAGRRRAAGAAADDGALGEGSRIPHGVRHGARGGAVSAREQPLGVRRPRGGAAPRLRRDHARAAAPVPDAWRKAGCCTARLRYNIASRFLDELPAWSVQWLSPQRGRDVRAMTRETAASHGRGAPPTAHVPGWRIGQSVQAREVRTRHHHRRRRAAAATRACR